MGGGRSNCRDRQLISELGLSELVVLVLSSELLLFHSGLGRSRVVPDMSEGTVDGAEAWCVSVTNAFGVKTTYHGDESKA